MDDYDLDVLLHRLKNPTKPEYPDYQKPDDTKKPPTVPTVPSTPKTPTDLPEIIKPSQINTNKITDTGTGGLSAFQAAKNVKHISGVDYNYLLSLFNYNEAKAQDAVINLKEDKLREMIEEQKENAGDQSGYLSVIDSSGVIGDNNPIFPQPGNTPVPILTPAAPTPMPTPEPTEPPESREVKREKIKKKIRPKVINFIKNFLKKQKVSNAVLRTKYFETKSAHEFNQAFNAALAPEYNNEHSGVYFTDNSIMGGYFVNVELGSTFVINLNEKYIAQYFHIGVIAGLSIVPLISYQYSSGEVTGDMSNSGAYEGLFGEATISGIFGVTGAMSLTK